MDIIAKPNDAALDRAMVETRAYSKATWRLLPFLFPCYVAAYLDRVNVGFAKLQMLNDLAFSETVYGLGAGIFFIGYFIFEVPSNIIMHRVGARIWIARIMITWAIISATSLFVKTPTSFYVMRFLLGVAEAGFFPGIVLYLTYWFPAQRRGCMSALFKLRGGRACLRRGAVRVGRVVATLPFTSFSVLPGGERGGSRALPAVRPWPRASRGPLRRARGRSASHRNASAG
jgi:MFS family permease